MQHELNDTTLVLAGGAVKALPDFAIGGYLVLWGGPEQTDQVGDWFTPDTWLGPGAGDGCDVLWNHGVPVKGYEEHAGDLLGACATGRDDVGIPVKVSLDPGNPFHVQLYAWAQGGEMGWSSGSALRCIRYADGADQGEITRWPIIEASLTRSPCETRARAVALKSLVATGDDTFNPGDDTVATGDDTAGLVLDLLRLQLELLRLAVAGCA